MRQTLGALAVTLILVGHVLDAEAASPLQPHIVGWERFFTVQWQPGTWRGRPVVSGYVLNDSGLVAARIRLLVEGIGPNGEVTGQQVVWLTGRETLEPGARAYFQVPAMPAAAHRVSVYTFDWVRPSGS